MLGTSRSHICYLDLETEHRVCRGRQHRMVMVATPPNEQAHLLLDAVHCKPTDHATMNGQGKAERLARPASITLLTLACLGLFCSLLFPLFLLLLLFLLFPTLSLCFLFRRLPVRPLPLLFLLAVCLRFSYLHCIGSAVRSNRGRGEDILFDGLLGHGLRHRAVCWRIVVFVFRVPFRWSRLVCSTIFLPKLA